MQISLKPLYTVSAYRAGSRKGASLVIVIPNDIVKKFSFSSSTIFTLRVVADKRIIMQPVPGIEEQEGVQIPPTQEQSTPQLPHVGADGIE